MTIIIAECGINHGGDADYACEMVRAAQRCGADAAKFQLFTDRARPNGTQFIISEDNWRKVMDVGKELGFVVFFSVFDFESVALAERLGAPWVKLSFVERRNSRLIARCNEANFERRIVSVDLYGQYNEDELAGWDLLYCPNNGWSGYYPTQECHIMWRKVLEEHHRRCTDTNRRSSLGWSCHCQGWYEAVIIAALCAPRGCIIEKHFKLDDDCIDAGCSLDQERFALMADMLRYNDMKWKTAMKGYVPPELQEEKA